VRWESDDHLAATVLSWVVVQPSLVYGEDSPSSRLFRLHASLPLIPLVGDGTQYVQPIHVEDLCALIGALLQPDAPRKCVVPAVGPRPITQVWTLLGVPAFSAMLVVYWLMVSKPS